jgi:chorismate--pyruvate lyase
MKRWTTWQSPLLQSLPPALRFWLTATGSLTRELQQVCDDDFAVTLLASGWQKPLTDEARVLHLPARQLAFTREVQLLDGAAPQVYARTVIPQRTYHAMRARFDSLGTQPLGEMLFNQPSLKRGPIQVARLIPGQTLFAMATRALQRQPDELWARRSCFYLHGRGMLVNEIFLPSAKWSD